MKGSTRRVGALAVGVLVIALAMPTRGAPAEAIPASRALGGSPGTLDVRVDLSAAHNLVRSFGVSSRFSIGDAALAQALAGDTLLTPSGLQPALARYAAELPDVELLPAGPTGPAGAATVRSADLGRVALITPGTGAITLPPTAQIVVVDLRDIPATDDLREILPRMVAPALATPVPQARRLVRSHDGPKDEFFAAFNIYSTGVALDERPPIPATGSRDLPIVLVVGDRIAPAAADFAASLRAAGRAWIAGESVPLEVAESTWQGVGDHGLAVRTSMFVTPTDQPPVTLPNQLVTQGNPTDPSTPPPTYKHDLAVPAGTAELRVSIDTRVNVNDLDLYVLFDRNRDGVFDFSSESVTRDGATGSADETVVLGAPPAGAYQVWVHGYRVPTVVTPFTLEIAETRAEAFPDELVPDMDEGPAVSGDYGALALRVVGVTPPQIAGRTTRAMPAAVDPFGFVHPKDGGRGALRAGLIIAHGAVRRFYRYFPVVGDRIDSRLVETLLLADSHDGVDRERMREILRRFGEALEDGHQFVIASIPTGKFSSSLPVFLDHDESGRPLVRHSRVEAIQPGDAIVALEGRPIEEVYAEELARTSAASRGYRFDIADRYIYRMAGPMTLTLEDPTGARRTVTVDPPPLSEYRDVVNRGVSARPNGPLTDLGEPLIYYFNLNRFTTPTNEDMLRAITEASLTGAKGMVLDMRGYPAVDHFQVAQRLISGPFDSPNFEFITFTGPDQSSLSTEQYHLGPVGAPSFRGPLVLLTGPHAVSAAENFMQMLDGAGRQLAVVGQPSAATNGNITAVNLPGGFAFSFTGMEVTNPDSSRFHGIGIVPDVLVPITAVDLRDGTDRDLLQAIDLLE